MKRIFKRSSNKNVYLLTPQGHWVRDLTKKIHPVDINVFTNELEFAVLAQNEATNSAINLANIDGETVRSKAAVIVSDGHDFEKKVETLAQLPRSVMIIGTNRVLPKWPNGQRIDFYVVNNPYESCLSYLPTNNLLPKCVVSSRTFPDFVRIYRQRRGLMFRYNPVRNNRFGGISPSGNYIDDYRNPICAAVGLAHRFGVSKLALLSCDDAFEDKRPGAENLDNGLFLYPQHKISHGLLDAMFYWLTTQQFNPIKVVDCSDGPKYENAPYINPEGLMGFFDEFQTVARKSTGAGRHSSQRPRPTEVQNWDIKR